jgi:hypothetical protein
MAELAAISAPSTDRTVQTRQHCISQIEDRFILKDKGAVWQYLFAHPELAPMRTDKGRFDWESKKMRPVKRLAALIPSRMQKC